ncbi:hypothetical protein ACHAWF_015310 [Thalassiosira exigua]
MTLRPSTTADEGESSALMGKGRTVDATRDVDAAAAPPTGMRCGYAALDVRGGPSDGPGSDGRRRSVRGKFLVALACAAVLLGAGRRRRRRRRGPERIEATEDGRPSLRAPPDPLDDLALFYASHSARTDAPLSSKSPEELGVPTFERPESSRPEAVFGAVRDGPLSTGSGGRPLPTNEWYLNLLVGLNDDPGPNGRYDNYAGEENRVYTIPYVVDTVGPIAGIRLHHPYVLSYGTVVQTAFVPQHGLTLGTADDGFTRKYAVDEGTLPNKLGVGVRWTADGDASDDEARSGRRRATMRSRILRGMPYGTVEYEAGANPTIASEIVPFAPIADGTTTMECGTLPIDDGAPENATGRATVVAREVELSFRESDATWLAFFSRPVRVRCYVDPEKARGGASLPPGAEAASEDRNAFQLRIEPLDGSEAGADGDPLVVRIALANDCTEGTNVNFCRNGRATRDPSAHAKILRDRASVYPTSASASHAFPGPEGGAPREPASGDKAYLFFDWAARDWDDGAAKGSDNAAKEPVMYALPHHVDILRRLDGASRNEVLGEHCVRSLHGNACLVVGKTWAMEEELGGLPSFVSPRPPHAGAVPALAEALSRDIAYALPDNYMRGAGDTYFSGKMLAKLGRIIVVADELRGLAKGPNIEASNYRDSDEAELSAVVRACKEATLPTEEEVGQAVDRLRRGAEVWLNGTAAAKLTYDGAWGGTVSCGCWFDGWGCSNAYPNCPSYVDPGLNFGQGFYNDHHFHFGYHIYAAAVAARFDPEWGKRHFERVLLLIRDIANPSSEDEFFPAFRQKDWYLGNSWASGIALIGGRPYLNGRNQESSSEAIAAYEGIAIFGSAMMEAFNDSSGGASDIENAHTARRIFDTGRFLAATEVRSADRFWHVYSPKRDQVYPDSYTPAVVSMMWDTMCQFQTWFGSAPYLAYGIQLLPLTPISERRDTDQWLRQLYPSFAESCDSDAACINEGWSVLLYSVLASLGHAEDALKKAHALPADVFESAGGSGHSLSNTLWYISTRPAPRVPYDLEEPSSSIYSKTVPESETEKQIDCGCPDICTIGVLSSNADGFTCKQRIQWLVVNKGLNELGACKQVALDDYPAECGACQPELCAGPDTTLGQESNERASTGCPPCNADVCRSDLNRCQIATTPYLCFSGASKGGCSSTLWETPSDICSACCELYEGCDER